ncbi:MAG: hypothetical protein E7166_01765 [Firmicutes bacterium]|nr:hypothetical protein [Bacillota bacterium]
MIKINKSILGFLFLIVLIFQYFIFINNDEQTLMTFNENNSNINNYANYIVDFKDTLNTKNFEEKFFALEKNTYQIKKIYIDVNKTWNLKLKKELSEYNFEDLNKFVLHYKQTLHKYNLSEETINIDVTGIKINKVLIYTSKENILKLGMEYQKK